MQHLNTVDKDIFLHLSWLECLYCARTSIEDG